MICAACYEPFSVPRGRGCQFRQYCDLCRDSGYAARMWKVRRGARYRAASARIAAGR